MITNNVWNFEYIWVCSSFFFSILWFVTGKGWPKIDLNLFLQISTYPKTTAVLVRNHGVFIWGGSWISAKTQVNLAGWIYLNAVKVTQKCLFRSSYMVPEYLRGLILNYVFGENLPEICNLHTRMLNSIWMASFDTLKNW